MYFQSRDMVIHWFLTRNARLPAKKTRSLCNSLSQRSLLKLRFELVLLRIKLEHLTL